MRFVYFFFFLWLPFILKGQQTGWEDLTISDGLSQGMIFDIKQDQKGFLWIATKDGLNRYDGYNFKVYTHDPNNPYSLSDNVCKTLLIDRYQRIWIGTPQLGLNLFDPQTEQFYHFIIKDQASKLSGGNGIKQLAEDPDGNIWINTEEDRMVKVTLPPSLRQGFPEKADFTDLVQLTVVPVEGHNEPVRNNMLGFRPDGNLYIWTSKAVFSVNWKNPVTSRTLTLFDQPFPDVESAYTDGQYWFLIEQKKVIGWANGQKRTLNLGTDHIFRYHITALSQHKLAIVSTRYIWIMTPEELFRQDSLNEHNAFTTLPANTVGVSSFLQDKTGNFWIGTRGYGLRKFNPRVRNFHSYLQGHSLSHILVDRQNRIYSSEGKDSFYQQFDPRTQQVKPINDQRIKVDIRPGMFLLQARSEFYWSFNLESGSPQLLKYSPDWRFLSSYPLPVGVGLGEYGNQAVEDAMGNIWIGASTGKLLRFDPKTERFDVYDYTTLLPKIGATIEVYTMLLEPDGTLWIGTKEGLVRVQSLMTKPVFTIYRNRVKESKSLSGNFVLSLCRDPHQPQRYLWVGTKGGGLDRLDKQKSEFSHFTEKQGLPNKVIYGILADEFNNLWISTNRGIAAFNPQSGKCHRYTRADGLQDDEFNNQSYTKTASGELIFGGINGLTIFKPTEILAGQHTKPIAAIIGLNVYNKPVQAGAADGILTRDIAFVDQIELSHEQNMVTFEFGVLDYTNVGKNQFRYQLEGIDHDWVEAGTNRFANYAQLPDGHYTLRMQGSTDGEIWSDPVSLQLRVYPPFYRAWWAYLLYSILLVLIGWQIYRVQTQRLLLQQQVAFEHREANRLAELDTLKTQFFTNISHELRTPLTLILGPLNELISQGTSNKLYTIMYRNARRLHMLINQILDLSRLDSGQLKLSPDAGDLSRDLRTWIAGFESLAQSRQLTLTSTVAPADSQALYDAEKLETIVVNLIANAIKFTEAGGTVQVQTVYEAERLTLVVADSGVGIAPEHLPHIFDRFYQGEAYQMPGYEGTGVGLALVHQLVQLMQGDITATSQPGKGTTFILTLPLRQVTTERPPDAIPIANAPFVSDGLPEEMPGSQPVKDDTRPTVLVVEDNDDLRYYISAMLASSYRILPATDGQHGFNLALEHIPDLIVTDLMMPRLDGLDLCRLLRQDTRTNHIPVVMLTAKAAIEDRLAGLETGADDYLTKPFVAIELLVRLKNLLRRQHVIQAYFKQQLTQDRAPITDVISDDGFTVQQAFVQQIYAVIDAHLDDPVFDIDQLAGHMAMSSRTLQRKLSAVLNVSAREIIRTYRLNRAAELLTTGVSSTEVAYQTGFSSPSNFSRAFREQFQVSPTAYAEGKRISHKPI